MNTKKIIATIVTILYFGTYWIICSWIVNSNVSAGISQIRACHSASTGYFSLRSYFVQYIIPLLLYIILMMQEDRAYIVIRYIDRKELWKIKIRSIMKYSFHFTCIHFGMDLISMLCFYSLEDIIHSQIVLYLLFFFPNVFFYFVFFSTVFIIFHVMFSHWKALVITSGMALIYYLFMVSGVVASWDPFFFLSLLELQMYHGINETDLILAYTNFVSLDVIVIMMGLKLYRKKEFSY